MADENVGLSGGLYAHASAVTNAAGNEVAEFRGGWTAEIATDTAEWFGQSRVRKDAEVVQTDVILTISEVAFKPGTLETIHGATKNASDNLKSVGAEAATSYTFDEDTVPPEMQWLVECKLDGKTFQAFAGDGIALGTPLNFTNRDYVVHDVTLMLYSATGTLVAFLLEN